MSFTAKGAHEVLVAGLQDAGFKVDVEKGLVTQTVRFLISLRRMEKLTSSS